MACTPVILYWLCEISSTGYYDLGFATVSVMICWWQTSNMNNTLQCSSHNPSLSINVFLSVFCIKVVWNITFIILRTRKQWKSKLIIMIFYCISTVKTEFVLILKCLWNAVATKWFGISAWYEKKLKN